MCRGQNSWFYGSQFWEWMGICMPVICFIRLWTIHSYKINSSPWSPWPGKSTDVGGQNKCYWKKWRLKICWFPVPWTAHCRGSLPVYPEASGFLLEYCLACFLLACLQDLHLVLVQRPDSKDLPHFSQATRNPWAWSQQWTYGTAWETDELMKVMNILTVALLVWGLELILSQLWLWLGCGNQLGQVCRKATETEHSTDECYQGNPDVPQSFSGMTINSNAEWKAIQPFKTWFCQSLLGEKTAEVSENVWRKHIPPFFIFS